MALLEGSYDLLVRGHHLRVLRHDVTDSDSAEATPDSSAGGRRNCRKYQRHGPTGGGLQDAAASVVAWRGLSGHVLPPGSECEPRLPINVRSYILRFVASTSVPLAPL